MKMSRLHIVVLVTFLIGGCSSGEDGQSTEPCNSSTNADGSVTIDCGSGGSATLVAPGNGDSVLVNVTEASATACPQGGQTLIFGVDTDGDGVLSEGEITQTTSVCNGVRGEQGPQGQPGPQGEEGLTALVTTEIEPVGDNCGSGGVRIDSGLDTNGNGVLDDGEITNTNYVCNAKRPAVPGESGAGFLKNVSLNTLEDRGWNVCFSDTYVQILPVLETTPANCLVLGLLRGRYGTFSRCM